MFVFVARERKLFFEILLARFDSEKKFWANKDAHLERISIKYTLKCLQNDPFLVVQYAKMGINVHL